MAKLPYPAIPAPTQDLASLMRTVQALKITVDMLTRQSGDERSWPVTMSELRRMGVVEGTTKLPDAPQR